jgi:hypothetical protein
MRQRPGWNAIPAVRNDRIVEIKLPLILQPGPAALTDGLDAIVAALWPESMRSCWPSRYSVSTVSSVRHTIRRGGKWDVSWKEDMGSGYAG